MLGASVNCCFFSSDIPCNWFKQCWNEISNSENWENWSIEPSCMWGWGMMYVLIHDCCLLLKSDLCYFSSSNILWSICRWGNRDCYIYRHVFGMVHAVASDCILLSYHFLQVFIPKCKKLLHFLFVGKLCKGHVLVRNCEAVWALHVGRLDY